MKVMKAFCDYCSGIGKQTIWKVQDLDMNTLHGEETTCEHCDGKGYTEHAVFSIEEAKAILKHCGLSTES